MLYNDDVLRIHTIQHAVFGQVGAVRLPNGEVGIVADDLSRALGRVSHPSPYYDILRLQVPRGALVCAETYDDDHSQDIGNIIVTPEGPCDLVDAFSFRDAATSEMAYNWVENDIVQKLWGDTAYDLEGLQKRRIRRLQGFPDIQSEFLYHHLWDAVNKLMTAHSWRQYKDQCECDGKIANMRIYADKCNMHPGNLMLYTKYYERYEADGWDMASFVQQVQLWYRNWVATYRAAGLIPDEKAANF